MSKFITAKIDVKKINKDLLFKGEKGTYLDLNIWINDEPDNYGTNVSIQQKTDKGAEKIYLGNGKTHKPPEQLENNEGKYKKTGAMSDIDELGF